MGLFDRGHIGLDIGTTAVRAAEIRGGERKPVVTRFGQVLLPSGAVVEGEVVEPALVAQAIVTLWKRAGFASRQVRVGVGNRQVVARTLELPAMSREDLEGAIRFQADEIIPMALEHAVMDFQVVEDVVGAEGQAMSRVLVVAAERSMVDAVVAAVQAAKLEPQAIDLNATALVRSVGTSAAAGLEAEAIIDIGGGVTNVVIHRGGAIQFNRLLQPSMGGDQFTDAVAAALGVDVEEAETLKSRASDILARRLGGETWARTSSSPPPDDLEETVGDDFEAEPDVTEPIETTDEPDDALRWTDPVETSVGPGDDPELERAADVLEAVMQRFVRQIRESVDFYTGQSADPVPLGGVVVTGGGSLLGGLRSQIGAALRIPAADGRPFSRVPVGKVKLSAEQISVAEPFLSVAVGLALGGLES